MDFVKLNSIAKCSQRQILKISELVEDRLYSIEDIRKINTQFGEKVIVDLESNTYCYLPARVSKALLQNNEEQLMHFQKELKKSPYSLRKLEGDFTPIEFLKND